LIAIIAAMRRVLFLAHHFPPIGGVVGRNVACAQHLPEHGYQPVVLTGPGEHPHRWAPQDAALVERVAGAEVHRIEGPIPADLEGTRARLARWMEQPPRWVHWWAHGAAEAGGQLGGPFDLILANLIPYETAFAAAELSRKLGIPWVADLEDPWALDEMRVAPTAINHRVDRARMRRGLATASGIIMNCREAADRLRAEMPDLGRVVAGIPHGFSADDFAAEAPERTDGAFRIVHTGALHTQLGRDHRRTARARRLLGGTSLDVDILTRSHVHLLEAIDRLADAEPALAGRIELHLAGHLTGADRELIEGRDRVHTYGQLSHPETIALARSADLLFVPMHDLPQGSRAGIVPCKTYEYLAAERPILAAVPDGDARDLLSRFERASVVRPADSAGMAAAIHARMLDPGRGAGEDGRESPKLIPYERRELTTRIAGVLDEVLGSRVEPVRVAAA
jgi:glycosyltransferase involved in cell wall biosynthesis